MANASRRQKEVLVHSLLQISSVWSKWDEEVTEIHWEFLLHVILPSTYLGLFYFCQLDLHQK